MINLSNQRLFPYEIILNAEPLIFTKIISKKINGANNRELFELENRDFEDLKSTMNSLESKLNN